MANVKVDPVGLGETELVASLYNQMFKPARNAEFFDRRFLGRYNPLIMIASSEGHPVGFALGFELKPGVFFEWLYGVMPDFRRAGVGRQLMDGVHAWAADHEYITTRLECQNGHRALMHMCIEQRYDVVGLRWDSDRGANLVIFEKLLSDI
ncbi:MAG: GNAT family N-acetyltransferase [Phycisphaera sp.]|nr:GNAT family N-acetyltransferase [Phycisphaera sp.]